VGLISRNSDDFPANGSPAAKWRFLLRYAVMAPSTRNSQPWLWRVNGEALELYADRDRELPRLDPRGRELIMSCGATLFHLRVALAWHNGSADISYFPRLGDDDLLARLVFSDGMPESQIASLFDGIEHRHTQRSLFEDLTVPDRLVDEFVSDAAAEGAIVHVVRDEQQRHELAHLVAAGDRQQVASASFRLGLRGQMRSNFTRSRDGMPGYAFGLDWLNSLLMPRAVEREGFADDLAFEDCLSVAYAPLLVVLGTNKDTPADWLAGGQALARVLLRAAFAGVQASFVNQPIQCADLRERVRSSIGMRGLPQVMLRMGYSDEPRATPRRAVKEVCRKGGGR
jgi:hypothetical protein